MENVIDEFRNKYQFLSNFYLVSIDTGMRIYDSVEHYYQAMKSWPGVLVKIGTITKIEENTTKKTVRQWISESPTPGEAKRRGRKINLRSDWEDIKIPIMKWGLQQKFTQETLAKNLLETHNKILIEGNWWHDNFWGECKCNKCKNTLGENMLGKLLMEVRNELKQELILVKRGGTK